MPSNVERECTIGGSPGLVANLGSRVGVVVTHPWGLLGGNYGNNVVSAVALYFQRLGVTTLRFNFSGSQVGRGLRQVEQVEEAARFLLGLNNDGEDVGPPSNILLVGYSYGSLICASASATIPQVIGVVNIAPPWSVKHWLLCFNANHHMQLAKKREALPRLFILGSKDNFTSEQVFSKTLEQHFPQPSATGAILKDADHFFGRREKDLMAIVAQWLVRSFPSCRGDLRRLGYLDLPRQQQERLDATIQPSDSDLAEDNVCGSVMGACT